MASTFLMSLLRPGFIFFEAPNEKEEQGWIDAIRKYLDSNHPKTKVNFKSEELAASGSVILEPPINGTAEYPTGT